MSCAIFGAQTGGGSTGNSLTESTTRGPHFDAAASKNVTALLGKTAYLNCRVKNLANRTEICESQQVINTRLNAFSGRIDGVEQQIDQVGIKVNRIEKVVEENKEEIERKLEDTRRQVQKEILEKINGLEHQLHRTSIADSGDYSTSLGIPLQNSTLMHAERSVHKILKPPTYDGQSSWSMYRRQFEAAAKANGWTSQEMATSLVISLRGQALEILQSIPEEQQNDYDRIIGALEIRYGHKYLRQVYQSQIKSRQQRIEENQERSLPEFVEDLRERMDRIHRFAREKLKIHSDKMKQRLDTTSTETAFKPGDAVWLYAPKRTKGKSPKLQSNWEGPYTIIKKINDLVYRIQLSPRSKPKVVHLEKARKVHRT
ncbi:hypothetical protein NQ318_020846 [Aromia moschata]|uniref:Integrase p58-like C-terminal domain-containing protein n=1 Tax=Aromia moschata TaxID=1265417 RepID=A0AAV8XBH0_9CUCU|nr:hypothetical protein NQ318_020846 [Aromia moschata]